jgi:hypothetical protein
VLPEQQQIEYPMRPEVLIYPDEKAPDGAACYPRKTHYSGMAFTHDKTADCSHIRTRSAGTLDYRHIWGFESRHFGQELPAQYTPRIVPNFSLSAKPRVSQTFHFNLRDAHVREE